MAEACYDHANASTSPAGQPSQPQRGEASQYYDDWAPTSQHQHQHQHQHLQRGPTGTTTRTARTAYTTDSDHNGLYPPQPSPAPRSHAHASAASTRQSASSPTGKNGGGGVGGGGGASRSVRPPSGTVSRAIGAPLIKPRRTLGSGLVPSLSSALFLGVVVVEALAVIGLVISVFALVEARTKVLTQDAKTVPVFLALFVFGMLFFVLIALDAFRLHNTIQVVGCVIYNIALLVTATLEVFQVRSAFVNQDKEGSGVPCPYDEDRRCNAVRTLYPAVRPMLIATPVLIGAAQIPLTYLTFKLWQDFGWQIYKKIGADLIKRRMMLIYQVFVVFLKFDFFFGSAFCIAYLILVSKHQDAEFALTIAALPAAIVVLALSAFAVRRELYSVMTFCMLCMVAGLVYFVWKITRIFAPGTEQQYKTVRLTLTFFSVFSIASLVSTLFLAIWCTYNFGRGLKDAHRSMGGFIGSLDVKLHRKHNSAHLGVDGGLAGVSDYSGGGPADGRSHRTSTLGAGAAHEDTRPSIDGTDSAAGHETTYVGGGGGASGEAYGGYSNGAYATYGEAAKHPSAGAGQYPTYGADHQMSEYDAVQGRDSTRRRHSTSRPAAAAAMSDDADDLDEGNAYESGHGHGHAQAYGYAYAGGEGGPHAHIQPGAGLQRQISLD